MQKKPKRRKKLAIITNEKLKELKNKQRNLYKKVEKSKNDYKIVKRGGGKLSILIKRIKSAKINSKNCKMCSLIKRNVI